MTTIDTFNEASVGFILRYGNSLVEVSTSFGGEIAKRDLGAALGPQRIATCEGTAQSRQELRELNHLIELSKHAFIEHRGAAEREYERMCLEMAPASAEEFSNYFNMRVRLDLEFEITLLNCMVDFCTHAIALCDLIDDRRAFLEVTPEMVCFDEDDDLESYQRLHQAACDAIAEHKRIDANRKAILAANVERLSR